MNYSRLVEVARMLAEQQSRNAPVMPDNRGDEQLQPTPVGDIVRWPGTPLAEMQKLGYGKGQYSSWGTGATFLNNLLKALEAERSNVIPLIRPK